MAKWSAAVASASKVRSLCGALRRGLGPIFNLKPTIADVTLVHDDGDYRDKRSFNGNVRRLTARQETRFMPTGKFSPGSPHAIILDIHDG